MTEEEEVVGEEEDETHYKKICFPPRIGMLGVVVGDHLPRILGDFGAFVVDAHHPPRNAQIVVYDRPAAPLEPIYHDRREFFGGRNSCFRFRVRLYSHLKRFRLLRYLMAGRCRTGPPCQRLKGLCYLVIDSN